MQSNTSQMWISLPSTLTNTISWKRCHNHFHFKIKQGQQHWHKLLIHITFITYCQNNREKAITINTKKHSSYFSSIWIQITHSTYTDLLPNHKRLQQSKATSHCSSSFGHEQGFWYSKHTQTYTNKHFKYHHQVHSQLHLKDNRHALE